LTDTKPARRTGKRRSNGQGTVYQRKDGRWEAKAFVLTTEGTERRVSKYGKTAEEASAELAKALADHHRGVPVSSASQYAGEYLIYWRDHIAADKVRPSTLATYDTYIRRYMLPYLDRRKLARLKTADLRSWLRELKGTCQCCAQGTDAKRPAKKQRCCAKGRCCGRYLSDASVYHVLRIMRAALQDAVAEDLLARNVARNVRVPAGRRKSRALSEQEARQFLRAAASDPLYALYAVALAVGLRRGEALGLRWEDLELVCGRCGGSLLDLLHDAVCEGAAETDDPNSGVLHVRQTLQRVKGALIFQPPKTQNSERSVPLPAVCVAVLADHWRRQREWARRAGADWRATGLVFTTRTGGPIDPRNLVRSFVALCDRAGIRRVRFHDLRHSCATLLFTQGVEIGTVKEILGHSSTSITANIYVEVIKKLRQDAVDGMNDLFEDGR
jgi:integrase